MSDEETIKTRLEETFDFLRGAVTVKRARRIFAEMTAAQAPAVITFAVRELGFTSLATITGTDEGATFGVIYHLRHDANRILLNLRLHTPRENPVIESVLTYFPSAELYERELEDLFGIKVAGLPPGRHYPLPENWPADQHPLRKDWKGTLPGDTTDRKEEPHA